MKYESLEDCNLEGDKLYKNISIAVDTRTHSLWHELKKYFRERDINIAENLRRCIEDELEELRKAKQRSS